MLTFRQSKPLMVGWFLRISDGWFLRISTNSENRVCRSHEKLFIITGVNFLLLFLRISLNAYFPTFVYVNKKSSHANCVRIIVVCKDNCRLRSVHFGYILFTPPAQLLMLI